MNRNHAIRVLFCVVAVVMGSTGRLHAARLAAVYSPANYNSSAVPLGDRLYTIGVWIDPVEGPGPYVLSANIGFQGAAGNPIQTNAVPTVLNVADRQRIQDLDDNGFLNASRLETVFNADSWWYSSSTGQLLSQGADDSMPPTLVTTDPVVGPTGALWKPAGNGLQGGNTSGTEMRFEGVFGGGMPVGPGFYPLAQLLISANVNVLFDANTSISLQPVAGGPALDYNVFGSFETGDPHAIVAFSPWNYLVNTNAIGPLPIPEPTTWALCSIGLPAILLAARAKRKRSPRAMNGCLD